MLRLRSPPAQRRSGAWRRDWRQRWQCGAVRAAPQVTGRRHNFSSAALVFVGCRCWCGLGGRLEERRLFARFWCFWCLLWRPRTIASCRSKSARATATAAAPAASHPSTATRPPAAAAPTVPTASRPSTVFQPVAQPAVDTSESALARKREAANKRLREAVARRQVRGAATRCDWVPGC